MADSKAIIKIIKNINIFECLDDKEIKNIQKLSTIEKIKMGEPILIGSDVEQYVFILIEGEVRQLVNHPKKKELISLNVENLIIFLVRLLFKMKTQKII